MDMDASATSDARRELTVSTGGRRLTLEAEHVLEIVRRPKATRVPHGPPALVGVFSLRGAVLPLISLARLMGIEAGTEQTVVILENDGPVGVAVDTVLQLGTGTDTDARHFDLAALLAERFERPVKIRSTSKPIDGAAVSAPPEAKRVLVSFVVNEQTFALPLAAVVEIDRLPDAIDRVPRAGRTVLGMINWRNRSLPILSLAGLLGFADSTADRTGRLVMVVHHKGSNVGLVADSIASVLRLDEAAIDKVPAVLQRGDGDAQLEAIGRTNTRSLVSILSVSSLFADPMVKETLSAQTEVDTSMLFEQNAADDRHQYLVFDLADERYGLSVTAVDEVLRMPETITRIPNAPRFMTGIFNWRGRPVPLIDQRQRFDVPPAEGTSRPRVVIVTVGKLQAGFVVDRVSEMIAVARNDLAVAPQLSSKESVLFKHVANVDDDDAKLILIVDPEELLSRAEQDALAEFTKPMHAEAR